MRFFCLISLKFLLLFGTTAAAQHNFNTSDYDSVDTDNECDAYCFRTLKPILLHMEDTRTQLKDYKILIQSKDEQISELKKRIASLRTTEMTCNEKNQYKDDLIARLKQKTVCDSNAKPSKSRDNLTETNETIENFGFEVSSFNSSDLLANDNGNQTNEELPMNCIHYENSTGINEIAVPNIGRLEVLCDYGGWTVIQKRFDGSEDFYRNWSDYRNGFGKLQGDFFIGLEALHQMTTSERYELLILLANFHGYEHYARYDNFVVAGEDEAYRLKSLGSYWGSAMEALLINVGSKFTTFDADNDRWSDGNYAVHYSSGGWFDTSANSNLFGKYFDSRVEDWQSIWWGDYHNNKNLKAVKMMIRPKD